MNYEINSIIFYRRIENENFFGNTGNIPYFTEYKFLSNIFKKETFLPFLLLGSKPD